MEEKINNKRIFRYIPSIIAKMILASDLKDEDIFFSKNKKKSSNSPSYKNSNSYIFKKMIEHQTSIQTNDEIFPVEYPLSHSIIMSVKLKGFQDLIISLNLKDKKGKKEKLNCEYIPILFSKIMLQISAILSENGGEILKCEDFEFVAVWDFSNIEDIRVLPKYQRFYAKHALISAFDIMKKIDKTEIVKNHKLNISIGIEYGESSIFFFGGERRRSDYVLMGETIEGSEHCLNQCNSHEIIIGREINNFFKRKGEITTTQVGTDDKRKNLYKIDIEKSNEAELKNFHDFKNMKLKSNYIVMNHKIYKNLSKKVYVFASVLPQGLVKYLDIGEDENLKELSIITFMTVHILMNLELVDNPTKIQHLIKDMQKATYLTRGSLLGVTRTFNGLMIKCAWGLEPNTFVDEPARAIATTYAMKKLIDIYKIKLSIGIATGACFTGLINIQGNRKMYSILGYKAIISRLLADKANRRNIRNKNNIILDQALCFDKCIVYCDKNTVKYSQKWYRYNYINNLYVLNESKKEENSMDLLNKVINDIKNKNSSHNKKKKTDINEKIEKKELKKRYKTMSIKAKDSNKIKQKNIDLFDKTKNKKISIEKEQLKDSVKIEEIYSPIEYDEYFFQNTFDPFPLIRTYKKNSHNPKNNTFSYTNYLNNYLQKENLNQTEIKEDNLHMNINNVDSNHIKNINGFNNFDSSPRALSKSVYYKDNKRKSKIANISEHQIDKRKSRKFMRVNTRLDSVLDRGKVKAIKENNNIYSYINNLKQQISNLKDYNSTLKLKNSQTIFGVQQLLNALVKHMTNIYSNNKAQFYLIRGPLGCGKSLFLRKILNNFLGLNDDLGPNYFKENYQFVFFNLLNPFREIMPYNTVSFILRKIFLLLKLENRIKDVLSLFYKFSLDDQTINNISFILSIGRDDVNLLNEYHTFKKTKKNKKKKSKRNKKCETPDINKIFDKNEGDNESIIKKYEGPFIYENIDEINNFFYEMIKLYFKHLKCKTYINNFSLPLIFIIDDIQLSNQYSIEFIKFLFKKITKEKEKEISPFICIMIQQTQFNNNFKKNIPLELDLFLNKYINIGLEPNITDKIICLDVGPPYEKNILKNIIIFHFKNSVLKQYGTQLNVVDNKILEFLLTKTFNGIPLLTVELLKSLIKSEKFIQTFSGEFIITSELNDESDIMDWNDILIPYIYEKITSNSINKILNFREILILKYASIIGTIFDMKILNKINPLNSIVKNEDILKLAEKLNQNYFLEFHNETALKKSKLICQISFPFLRETLYQKFLMETRAPFHMKLAVIISMSKRIIYFSLDDELKFLKRNLTNSEANIIDEMKRKPKELETLKDILETQKDLSYNNLKILLIKEICHNFYKKKFNDLLEGNIEIFSENKSEWIPVFYLFDNNKIIFYNQDDEKKREEKRKPILIFKLTSIFKNEISTNYSTEKKRNNILEISISEEVSNWVQGIYTPRRNINYYFSSDRMKDIYQLEIGINFLKMKVNYDTFADYYGHIKFPLFKLKWFVNKEQKYYFDKDIVLSSYNQKNKIIEKAKTNNFISVEKLIDNSHKIKKSFELIVKSTFACFLGLVQKNITLTGKSINKINKNTNDNKDLIIQIPNHIQKPLNNVIFLYCKSENKNENDYFNNITSNKNIMKDIDSNENSENSDKRFIDLNKENITTENKKDLKDNISFKLDFSFLQKRNSKEENLKLSSNSNRNNNKDLSINNEFEKKHTKKNYAEFINKATVSFPKKPASSIVKEKKINDLDEEPYFTESNYNTKNNISSQQGDNSTKLSASINIKNISNNEESILDLLGLNNSINSKAQIITKKLNNTNISIDNNKNVIFNFDDKKIKKISRNIKKANFINKSVENTFSINNSSIDGNNKLKTKNNMLTSYDNIFISNNNQSEELLSFKTKDELKFKNLNKIQNDNSKLSQIYPSFKFDITNNSQDIKYLKISDNPKYMYLQKYNINKKIHKSKFFSVLHKKKNDIYK